MTDDFNGSNSTSARPEAIRELQQCDAMDLERKALSDQHKAKKKSLATELGMSMGQLDLLRKIQKFEESAPGETAAVFKDAYDTLRLGEQLDWLNALATEQPKAESSVNGRAEAPISVKRAPKYPFGDIAIGQTILIENDPDLDPNKLQPRVASAANQYCKQNPETQFKTHKTDDGVELTRIA
jgi:hypothetical protein